MDEQPQNDAPRPRAGGPETPDIEEKLSLRRFFRILWRYFPFLKPYWSELVLLFFVLPLAGSAIVVMPALCTKLVIDVAFPRRSALLLALFAGTAVMMMLLERFFLVFIRNIVGAHVRTRIVEALGRRFYRNMVAFNMRYHHNTPVGEKIFRCDTDILDTAELLGMAVPMTVQYGYQFVFTVAAMCLIDWRPVVVAAACSPVFLLVAQKLYNYYRRVDLRQRLEGQKLTAQLEQSFANMAVVYAHGARRFERLRYYRALVKYSIANMVYWFMNEVSIVLVWPSSMPATVAGYIVGLCAYWVITGSMSLGQWQAMNQLIIQAIVPLGILISYYQVMRLRMVPAERILNLFDLDAHIKERPGALPPATPLRGEIEFRNVHFAYDPEKPVLRGVSFTIKPGSRIAFVGPSGIGKTTIMNLLLRFYDPDQGEILVDGQDIRDLELTSYRRQFGIVLQSPVIFDRTIRENILYGAGDIDPADFRRAVEVAQLDEFVGALPQGYDTPLQEGGNLSLGQKQRIAVARCIAGRPGIVLLDEPTALVDPASTQQIVTAIDHAAQGRTTSPKAASTAGCGACRPVGIWKGRTRRTKDPATHEPRRTDAGEFTAHSPRLAVAGLCDPPVSSVLPGALAQTRAHSRDHAGCGRHHQRRLARALHHPDRRGAAPWGLPMGAHHRHVRRPGGRGTRCELPVGELCAIQPQDGDLPRTG